MFPWFRLVDFSTITGNKDQDCRGVEKISGEAEKFLKIRLRALRKKTGLTQEQYAEQARFSYKYYQGIERGQWTNLRLRTLEKLADGYGIAIHDCFLRECLDQECGSEIERGSGLASEN